MTIITNLAELDAIYGKPGKAATVKVAKHITPNTALGLRLAAFARLRQ